MYGPTCRRKVNLSMRSWVTRRVKLTSVVVVKNRNTVVSSTPILNATKCWKLDTDPKPARRDADTDADADEEEEEGPAIHRHDKDDNQQPLWG
jgi:hypothetical protein